MKIVPSTRKISTIEGTMPHSTLLHSAQPRCVRASGGSGGTQSGRISATPAVKSRKMPTCSIEGPKAPLYMSPTERPNWSASTMSTSDGGITCVMVPDAAITPVA